MRSDVLAVLCSDIHLCHAVPTARSDEPDWYEAMGRILDQLSKLAQDVQAPILCSGDVFDRWNSPPELINFAIERLPVMQAVPGQHDLPHHSLEEIKRSAFWTLVEAGKLNCCLDGYVVMPSTPRVRVYSFPWGVEPCSQDDDPDQVVVALCHRYVWRRGRGYPGAPPAALVGNIKARGYDAMVFGDNHQSFDVRLNPSCKTFVVNPGCLIPRRRDERTQGSNVYLLKKDRSVERVQLDNSEDWWLAEEEEQRTDSVDLSGFIEELRSLESDGLDFESAVHRYCEQHRVDSKVRDLIRQAMEV